MIAIQANTGYTSIRLLELQGKSAGNPDLRVTKTVKVTKPIGQVLLPEVSLEAGELNRRNGETGCLPSSNLI